MFGKLTIFIGCKNLRYCPREIALKKGLLRVCVIAPMLKLTIV